MKTKFLGFGWIGFLCALVLASLPVLGWLQLRWIDALTDVQADRMRSLTRVGLLRVVDDFERQMQTRADALASGRVDSSLLHREVVERDPLVRDVLAIDAQGRLLSRVSAAGPIWDGLEPWREYFDGLASDPSRRMPSSPLGLVVPVLGPADAEFVLALLDEPALIAELAESVKANFLPDGPPIRVAVDSADGLRWSSHEAYATEEPDDATAPLSWGQEVTFSRGPRGRESRLERDPGQRREVDLRMEADGEEVVLAGSGPSGLEGTFRLGLSGGFALRARHAAGSIEAAAGRARVRNLALGMGMLALLGLATGLVYLASRRAQRLAEQRVSFVAGVTHELRTPLAVIQSAAENLRDGVIETPDGAARYGALIRGEARRLSDLVEQALSLAGARDATADVQLEPVDVPRLLRDAVDRCAAELDQARMVVCCDAPSRMPAALLDGRAIENAVVNLLTNAIKYRGDGSRIWIECDVHDGSLRIRVRDDGIGVASRETRHLFRPFYRANDPRVAKVAGTGLGLSVVQRTAEAHGGRAGVQPNDGRGSVFWIQLPLDESPA